MSQISCQGAQHWPPAQAGKAPEAAAFHLHRKSTSNLVELHTWQVDNQAIWGPYERNPDSSALPWGSASTVEREVMGSEWGEVSMEMAGRRGQRDLTRSSEIIIFRLAGPGNHLLKPPVVLRNDIQAHLFQVAITPFKTTNILHLLLPLGACSDHFELRSSCACKPLFACEVLPRGQTWTPGQNLAIGIWDWPLGNWKSFVFSLYSRTEEILFPPISHTHSSGEWWNPCNVLGVCGKLLKPEEWFFFSYKKQAVYLCIAGDSIFLTATDRKSVV